MLAYTTLSDYIHLATASEFAVYALGLLAVIAVPSLLFSLMDKLNSKSGQNSEKS